MNASKEQARQAQQAVEHAAELLDEHVKDKDTRDTLKKPLLLVQEFLEAAERKLPSEESYNRDKKRAKAGK